MPQLVAKVLDVNPAPKAASPASPAGKPQTAKGASFRDALSQVQEKVKPKAAPAKTTGVSSKGSPLARAATRTKDAAKASEPKPARAGKRAEKAGARKGDEPAADVGASRKAKAP